MLNFSSLNWRGRFVRYAPVFLWIGVIFYLSSSSGSMAETSRFIGPLLHFFLPSASEETRLAIHGYIRKSAHFTGYAILAFLIIRAITNSSVQVLRNFRFVIALSMVSIVAVIDELNQSRNPSRTGSVLDILLDISGGTVMTLALWRAKWPRRSTNEKLSTTDPSEM